MHGSPHVAACRRRRLLQSYGDSRSLADLAIRNSARQMM
jgi:hypothetical protein